MLISLEHRPLISLHGVNWHVRVWRVCLCVLGATAVPVVNVTPPIPAPLRGLLQSFHVSPLSRSLPFGSTAPF